MKNTIKFEYSCENGERKIYEVLPVSLVSEPQWALRATVANMPEDRLFVLDRICRFLDEHLQRFLCVTIYVINQENKFLLIKHKKLGKWVPPGGKVDRHETPDEAAIRECYEETGVKIELMGERTPVDGGLIAPIGSQLNTIILHKREHVDLIYLAKPMPLSTLCVSEREAEEIGWFSYEDVKTLDTFPSVIQWCEKLCLNITNSNL